MAGIGSNQPGTIAVGGHGGSGVTGRRSKIECLARLSNWKY
jgi:hypothetical protein